MKLRHLLALLSLSTAGIAMAQTSANLPVSPDAATTASGKPKLIVVISVDQYSADLFNEFRSQYREGLKRLTQGAVFPRGYQSHAATETCPGHSTILTGDHPSRTGIIANTWFDLDTRRADKAVYCAEDESVPGTDSDHYVASVGHLKVPTLGGRMKAANPATRVVSVAGKDRAAIMMGGKDIDQIWWWGGKGFVSYKGTAETPLLTGVNAGVMKLVNTDRLGMEVPANCTAKDWPVDIGAGKTVGTGRFARAAGDTKAFRASPEMDAATLVLAASLIENMQLGKQAQTDIISIGLSANDYIGHTYGTEGLEMCIQQMSLDRELGAFFDRLDADGIDYMVALTADHGGHDLPERSVANAQPAETRVNPALSPKAVNEAIAAKTGLSGQLIHADGAAGDFYIAHGLSTADRKKVLDAALAFYKGQPQVAAVLTHEQIAASPVPVSPPDTWTLLEKARESFDAHRSGDFLVMLKPNVMPIPDPTKGYVATHGSPWDMDRRVPILFWRKGMTHFEQPLAVETVDIAPTLAGIIGLPVKPGDMDGRCLDVSAGAPDSCKGM